MSREVETEQQLEVRTDEGEGEEGSTVIRRGRMAMHGRGLINGQKRGVSLGTVGGLFRDEEKKSG